MKTLKSWLRLFLCFLFIVPVMGTTPAFAQTKIKVTDLAGRQVQVPRQPQRIICLGPGCLRLICYLGSVDRVVGIEQYEIKRPLGRPYRYANPDLAKLPVVGPGGPGGINKEPDLEAVLRIKPDLIFITYMEPARAQAMQQKLGIPVVVLTYGRLATFDSVVYQSLRLTGKILGREQRAEEIVSFIENARKDLQRRTADIPDHKKPWVYVGGVGYKGAHGLASTEPRYIPLEWVGAKNLAEKVSQRDHVFVDKERILAWNPKIIFLDGTGFRLVAQEFQKDPRFYQGLRAFQKQRVYLLFPFNFYMTNIGSALADAYAVGKILYPQKFTDIDPAQRTQEIYTFFVGKPVYNNMVKYFGQLGQVVRFEEK
jgi:iron complex transport system substrate-binding protein